MARILIVDADTYLRTLLRVYLYREGHTVTEAGSIHEALKIVDASTPDVILCDIFMTGMSGQETIRALIRKCPGVPVVAMSGEGGFESHPDLLSLGAPRGVSGGLSKPFSRTSVLAAVDQALAQHRRTVEPTRRLFSCSPLPLATAETLSLGTVAARNALKN